MYKKKLNINKNYRYLSMLYEVKLVVFKIVFNFFFKTALVDYVNYIIYNLSSNVFFSKTRNLCTSTGRQNGIIRLFNISRIGIRNSNGTYYGLRKSSW